MAKKLGFENSNGVLKRQIDVDDNTGTIKIYDDTDAEIMDIENHGSRHAYGGTDAIPNESLRFTQIAKVFGQESVVTVSAGETYIIPKGVYLVSLGANTSVEYSPDGGTTWRILIPAGHGGLVISDGVRVRLNNSGTESENSYLLPIE